MRVPIAILCFTLCLGAVDLEAVKKEPDLQKRSELALDAAAEALKHARTLPAEGGSVADLQVDMDTMVQAVELSLKSLHDTGKRPDKLGRYYKKGELRTREMLKQLENLFGTEPVQRHRAEVVEESLVVEFLFGVMSGK